MIKNMLKIMCLVSFLGLAGCNTMEGIGRDATAMGQSITGSATKHRAY